MVDAFLDRRGHHHVFRLQQTAHHIKNSCASHVGDLRPRCQRRIASHEEVKPRGGGQGRDEADEVVVHVAGVAEGGSAHRHHLGYLQAKVNFRIKGGE